MAGLYHNALYPVRDKLDEAHRDIVVSLSRPGTWWTSAERAALAGIVRKARRDAGIQDDSPEPASDLAEVPDSVRHVVSKIAVSPETIDRSLLDDALADGLGEEAYVEAVAIAARLSNVDDFARGLGVEAPALPPVVAGEPSRVRPAEAVDEGAWLPTVPSGEAGGETGKRLYGKEWAANILRALSLVPDECASIIALEEVQYRSVKTIMDFDFSHDPAIARTQVELVAARVSALNACFY